MGNKVFAVDGLAAQSEYFLMVGREFGDLTERITEVNRDIGIFISKVVQTSESKATLHDAYNALDTLRGSARKLVTAAAFQKRKLCRPFWDMNKGVQKETSQ
jgi:hypothetical protein